MKYYVRNSDNSEITGPFSLEEIAAKLRARELASDVWATGDIGDSPRRVAQSPMEDWMRLQQIPGLDLDKHAHGDEFTPGPPPLPLAVGDEGTTEHNALQPSDSGVAFCPHCGHKVSANGDSVCAKCGKPLSAQAATPAASPAEKPFGVVSAFSFVAGVVAGFIFQVVSFFFLGGVLGAFLGGPRGESKALVPVGILLCVLSLVLGKVLMRSGKPTERGVAFGILLGVGLTGLLTATCAMK